MEWSSGLGKWSDQEDFVNGVVKWSGGSVT